MFNKLTKDQTHGIPVAGSTLCNTNSQQAVVHREPRLFNEGGGEEVVAAPGGVRGVDLVGLLISY